MATLTLRSAKGSPLVSLGTIAGTTVSVTSVTTTAGLTVGGSSTLSTSATVTAAGSDQSGATALTKSYNIVTTATADQGVVLPDCVVGLEAFLLNDTAVNVKIYPASGESIDGGSANAAVDLAPGHSLKLVGVSATKWNRLSPVIIYNSSGTRVN